MFCFTSSGLLAQNGGDVQPVSAGPAGTEVFTLVEEPPEFPGGISEMYKFVSSNIKYPRSAIEAGLSGKCFLKFIVSSEGKMQDVVVLKGVPGCPDCDAEALRVVKMMPDWTPGRQNGKPVNVYYTLPVSFKSGKPPVTVPGEKLTPEQQQKHDAAMKHYNEGHQLDQKGKYAQALEKFNASLQEEPENKYALFDKARMHLSLGQKQSACEVWNKMKSQNIRPEEVEEALKKNCN